MKRLQTQSGFTLLETLIYIALFALLSILLISSLVALLRSYTETRAQHDVLDSARISMERMTREIRGASSVDTAASTLGSSPGVLKLNTTDASGTAKTVQFSVSSNVLKLLDSVDGTTRDLTGSKVSITSLTFRNITTTAGSAVRVEMTIQEMRGGSSGRSFDFYDTVALRGSY